MLNYMPLGIFVYKGVLQVAYVVVVKNFLTRRMLITYSYVLTIKISIWEDWY